MYRAVLSKTLIYFIKFIRCVMLILSIELIASSEEVKCEIGNPINVEAKQEPANANKPHSSAVTRQSKYMIVLF